MKDDMIEGGSEERQAGHLYTSGWFERHNRRETNQETSIYIACRIQNKLLFSTTKPGQMTAIKESENEDITYNRVTRCNLES